MMLCRPCNMRDSKQACEMKARGNEDRGDIFLDKM